jgi:hypothetical protein
MDIKIILKNVISCSLGTKRSGKQREVAYLWVDPHPQVLDPWIQMTCLTNSAQIQVVGSA